MTQHGALSIIADIPGATKAQLARLLEEMDASGAGTNNIVPFAAIPNIHFARFVLLDEGTFGDGVPYPARLVFDSSYDLSSRPHIDELIAKVGPGLWKLFSSCEGFPKGLRYNPSSLESYLHSVTVKTNTFYVGVGSRSVQQVRQEHSLREAIEAFVDDHEAELQGKNSAMIRDRIIAFVKATPALAWASQPEPGPSLGWKLAYYGKLIAVLIVALAVGVMILPFLLVWILIIFFSELREKTIVNTIDKAHLRALVARETGPVQTQFSAYGEVKPGFVRVSTMSFLLKMTDFLGPYLFNKGRLSGIPTVHFARWLIPGRGRQMIFLSNFDGNSEGYLRDFINIAAKQLTLLFCHTVGYPRTRLMVFGGAKDARGFMEWARRKQVITTVWYSANPIVSLKNIYTNAAIRNGLYGLMNEEQSRNWLKNL